MTTKDIDKIVEANKPFLKSLRDLKKIMERDNLAKFGCHELTAAQEAAAGLLKPMCKLFEG